MDRRRNSMFEQLEERSLFSAVPGLAGHAVLRNAHNLNAIHVKNDITIVPHVTNTVATGYTPAQISHAYGFDKISFAGGSVKGNGAGQTIAIVDAYDDPNIGSDLAAFDAKFNLPNPSLSELKASNINANSSWSVETSLDVEWAHAVAPAANIVLIEAKTSGLGDLLSAVNAARTQTSASAVSMSWGGGEFSSETYYDSYFTTPYGHTPMTFVASSGDTGAPVSWPAVSPNVLSVGGTNLQIDSAGNYISESAWTGSGGGISNYEPRPSYMNNTVGNSTRTNPDVAYDADPNTGYLVYDSVTQSNGASGWFQVGGTSAAAPQWAGIVAIANQGRATVGKTTLNGRTQTLPAIYNMARTDYHDIVTGHSTGSPAFYAGAGYDGVTGLGTPNADLVTSVLVNT
jgi:subtilase family serine protease